MKTFLTLICFLASFAASATPRDTVSAVLLAEAGGEGPAGIQAVAEVVHSRMVSSGASALAVVSKPKQFSCLNGVTPQVLAARQRGLHPSGSPERVQAEFLAKALCEYPHSITHSQLPLGYDHYHEKGVRPKWAKGLTPKKIGNHWFYAVKLPEHASHQAR